MDNEAFKALVRDRAVSSAPTGNGVTKSTKEIAREAVEAEYRRKRSTRGQRRQKRSRGADDNDDVISSDSEGGGGARSDSDEEIFDRKGDENVGEEEEGTTVEGARWKQLRNKKRKKRKEDGGDSYDDTPRYRDRAKERREGKNYDYEETSGLLQGVSAEDASSLSVDAAMSKFLGGDEAHTHLVKGLDYALAEKVRREEMGITNDATRQEQERRADDDIDLEEVRKEAIKKKTQKTERFASSYHSDMMTEASLEQLRRTAKTSLGRTMVSYLQHRLIHKQQQQLQRHHSKPSSSGIVGGLTLHSQPTAWAVPTSQFKSGRGPTMAGLAVQRSTLAFSISGNIHDRQRAWEIPKETTTSVLIAASNNDSTTDSNGDSAQMTQLDKGFIRWIRLALDSINDEEERRKNTRKKKTKKMKKKERKHRKRNSRDNRASHSTIDSDHEKNDDNGDSAEDRDVGPKESTVSNNHDNTDGSIAQPLLMHKDQNNGRVLPIGNGAGISAPLITGKDKDDDDDKNDNTNVYDDDDEDIFENAGEYVPPVATTCASAAESGGGGDGDGDAATNTDDKNKNTAGTEKAIAADTNNHDTDGNIATKRNIGKKSIFSGLLHTNDASSVMRRTQKIRTDDSHSDNVENENQMSTEGRRTAAACATRAGVVNRDILGLATSGKQLSGVRNGGGRRRGGCPAGGGVSLSVYEGGYGEEMDVDFDSRLDDDDNDDRRKSSKAGEKMNAATTTTAAMEYGTSRGKTKSMKNKADDGG